MRKASIAIFVCVFLLAMASHAQQKTANHEWPQFRGPNGSGVLETTGLPSEFGPEKNVIWKKIIPTGYSSPILIKDRIFLTACENEKLLTICLDRKTGETIWKKEAPRSRKEKLDFRNNPASPSPATDSNNVFVFFPDFGMVGYDFSGKELWRLPLDPLTMTMAWAPPLSWPTTK